MIAWDHQVRGIGGIAEALGEGMQRLCLTAPTGAGKSYMLNQMLKWGMPSLVLCNRSMLFEQLARGLNESGIPYGLQASGYAPGRHENVTLGMMQTITKRWSEKRIELPPAKLVFVDELHNEAGPRTQKLLQHYIESGATTIGITATPVGISHVADHLIQAGVNSELRKCGALVGARTYAPDEFDASCFKGTTKGVLQLRDECREIVLKVVFGRVIEHYHKLNGDQRPAILFAPGVAESRWFCEMLNEQGVPASHIDAEGIVLNGQEISNTRESRELLADASRRGITKVVCNRFVLREGIDWPWLYHCIFACKFGGICSYLQAGGRLLRAYKGLDHVIVQDHGGNCWTHGSLNEDREWSLDDTERSLADGRKKALQAGKEKEPITCPSCHKVRESGATCPSCGFAYRGSRRIVVQTDGSLVEVDESRVKQPKGHVPAEHDHWAKCYWRSRKTGLTFSQAAAIYRREGGDGLNDSFPLYPKRRDLWSKRVADVSWSDLTGKKFTAGAILG